MGDIMINFAGKYLQSAAQVTKYKCKQAAGTARYIAFKT